MFDREIEKELAKWKVNPYRKPLIIRGARQVGKTSVARKFGQENFDQIIEINLEKRDQLQLFDQAVSVDDFLRRINLVFDKEIIPGSTLLFIDEIQESKNVMQLLRFFAEEKPELHVMAAGSLLEARIDESWSIPVGRVEYRYLYPMTFFEYLKAKGKTALLESLQEVHLGENFPYGDLACELFKEYLIVGGMPEVVRSFMDTADYGQIKAIFNRLQVAYMDDIRKYSRPRGSSKYLELILEQGSRLAGTIFKYENFGGSSYHSREIGEAIQTIEKVMLLKQVLAVNSVSLPVMPKTNRPKKMIWLDVGLVNNINNVYQEVLSGKYQGSMMEQIVGQSLLASGADKPMELYYWARDKQEGSAEVDFCFQNQTKLVGLEVKSGNVSKMKSLFSMADLNKEITLMRVSWEDIGKETIKYAGKEYTVLSLPFYLIDRCREFLD